MNLFVGHASALEYWRAHPLDATEERSSRSLALANCMTSLRDIAERLLAQRRQFLHDCHVRFLSVSLCPPCNANAGNKKSPLSPLLNGMRIPESKDERRLSRYHLG